VNRNVLMTAATLASGIVAAAAWWRKHPSACPYGQRFWVEAPHPFITRSRLRDALAPQPGETLLEVGPGTGYYTLHVARLLAPSGSLHICDLQREMLDHTMRRASEHGVTNIEPAEADARRLPYGDAVFDGAFLVAVLGEIPDRNGALRELRRVIKPHGRVGVAELFGDPHMVGRRTLGRLATASGFELARRVGPRVGYFAVLRPAAGSRAG
jgi:ubiquinone/menaquinone biosynthesis C-methylase UbiE